jgi:NDP-sugar pyrophosphorylase family protein
VLPKIKGFIMKLIPNLGDEYKEVAENVYVHKSAKVANSACIVGPTIICSGAEIRHCAYIRGSVIIGDNCVIGNSTELKNAILLDKVQVPHYNYVGDSILGEHAHLGAGVILSNLKADNKSVVLHTEEGLDTGLRKVGSFLGENVDVGCNSVLNPGTVILKNSRVYPLTSLRGVFGENKIIKSKDNVVDLI